ncbi:glycoside hydrolase family 30 protein [Acidicapsa acidisoli]|uniref:glycoside hydrolase family 30 protein n=1 Tax=Acidicapsa acidisoli TaxID=1615681 RepID=UPI0021DFF168|nr:glycoside hydrolase family 30 beta sandwich domain-containing protein [Acidicapsa acidisoli]
MQTLRRCLTLSVFLSFTSLVNLQAQTVAAYQTTPDLKQALQPEHKLSFAASPAGSTVISVDDSQRFQTMDGFGAAMTDSSAWLLQDQLTASQRKEVMRKLFDPRQGHGIGVSFLRVPLGASDLARNHYSYDDMPAGQRDPELKHFSIDHDRAYILPAMLEALKLDPSISVMVTPWSPPGWMKTKDTMNGGQLLVEDSQVFANYLADSVSAYDKAGVLVRYLSLQNEPLYETKDYPGTLMHADQETKLIASFVGPALQKAGLKTSILAYDHNWDHPEYPVEVLSDPDAAQYTAGSAFHCYGGNVSAQGPVHERFPNRGIWMTECSGGTWQKGNLLADTEKLVIESSRQWAKSVVLWGLALDEKNGPNTGGCATCRGFVTIDRSTAPHKVTYTEDYYAIGHASEFVHPGAVRIDSTDLGPQSLETVAFQNTDGSIALLVLNNADQPADFSVSWHGKSFQTSLSSGSVATYRWLAPKPTAAQ